MKQRCEKSGFTLIEVMMALALAVVVFVAMGSILSRSFSLWLSSNAQWQMAQHARVARARLLDGGFGAGTGLLSSSNVTIAYKSGEAYVSYEPLTKLGGIWQAYGWTNAAAGKDIRLLGGASNNWALGQNVAASNYMSSTKVDLFRPFFTNGTVTITYRLLFSAAGKTFEQPCTVSAYLVN